LSIPFIEENDQTQARREHLNALRALVGNVYPNKFVRSNVAQAPGGEDTISVLTDAHAIAAIVGDHSFESVLKSLAARSTAGEKPEVEELRAVNEKLNKINVRISGRIASPPRVMGKAAFVHLSDGVSRLQIYVRKADVQAINNDTGAAIEIEGKGWELFGLIDHGDFIGVAGYLFVTKTGELSVHVTQLQFLSKALLPMPDKMHGISDPEIRQRQRYADLIAGSLKLGVEDEGLSPREVFDLRSRVVRELRRFLDDHGYVEVETPMLTPKATGALARPFKTHHNALDIDLYARIAPELYLKRLVVGGFEKVYELNRNFRNEGIDRTHNPEFTMLEFYCAYMDANGMMDFYERMLRATVFAALGHTHVRYEEYDIDFGQSFQRLTMKEAVEKHWPDNWRTMTRGEFRKEWLDDPAQLMYLAAFHDLWTRGFIVEAHAFLPGIGIGNLAGAQDRLVDISKEYPNAAEQLTGAFLERNTMSKGITSVQMARIVVNFFEGIAEPHLDQPTFVTDFPKPISPLSKASPKNASIAERFELFIGTIECGNGFSELNDPEEQYHRFREQSQQRESGDEEAMVMDEDYIRALSYGMPPAAGIGIGIDRLIMLLGNKHSIRDVILFPHMRQESQKTHQFSWLKWIYDEICTADDWWQLDNEVKGRRFVERFMRWANEPDSLPNRKTLLGESEENIQSTAQRALRLFEG
jgi:lysyl-tRNA synthetase class 2